MASTRQRRRADQPKTPPGHAEHLLVAMLSAAVPLWIAQAARCGDDHRRSLLTSWADAALEPVSSHADVLLAGSREKGSVAEVFNHFARAVAALAHNPGGVNMFGLLWCARHAPAGTPGDTCPSCAGDLRTGGRTAP